MKLNQNFGTELQVPFLFHPNDSLLLELRKRMKSKSVMSKASVVTVHFRPTRLQITLAELALNENSKQEKLTLPKFSSNEKGKARDLCKNADSRGMPEKL